MQIILNVTTNFLGIYYAENYSDTVKCCKAMGFNGSGKGNFFEYRLDFFLENLRSVSDQNGERFYQEISIMEKRY
jgi:hypothetical protein